MPLPEPLGQHTQSSHSPAKGARSGSPPASVFRYVYSAYHAGHHSSRSAFYNLRKLHFAFAPSSIRRLDPVGTELFRSVSTTGPHTIGIWGNVLPSFGTCSLRLGGSRGCALYRSACPSLAFAPASRGSPGETNVLPPSDLLRPTSRLSRVRARPSLVSLLRSRGARLLPGETTRGRTGVLGETPPPRTGVPWGYRAATGPGGTTAPANRVPGGPQRRRFGPALAWDFS